MTKLLLIAGMIVIASCNSNKKDNTTTGEKKDTSTVVSPKDTGMVQLPPPSGKIDIETFGDLKIGQPFSQAIVLLGEPGSKGKAIEWAADGLVHQDMSWKEKGLAVNTAYEKTDPTKTSIIYTITAAAPCTFKTRAGMGIGNTYAEVQEAYKRDIDPEATDKTQITVGSIYGGIIFSFKDDKVNKVFLGAEAE